MINKIKEPKSYKGLIITDGSENCL